MSRSPRTPSSPSPSGSSASPLRHFLGGLSLGIGLIVASAALLLYADRGARHRDSAVASGPVPIAIVQFSSGALYDETTAGFIDGLASRGYTDGRRVAYQRFNAEGDFGTVNLIANRVTDGSFPLVATSSTLCLQGVASANRQGKTTQVFWCVSDPVAAGVGITALDSINPKEKPTHLTGLGTAQPVEAIFTFAKKIEPRLKRVGVAWNPAEANSEVCTRRARAICKELGIELLEAPVEGTRDVKEAAESLIQRGAEALWAGGDLTVITAFDTLVAAARNHNIPVFSNIGGHIQRGALFDLGANYYQVGFHTGEIAAEILDGKPASEIPVTDFMPQVIGFNQQAGAGLRLPWQPTPAILEQAASLVGPDGTLLRTPKREAAR